MQRPKYTRDCKRPSRSNCHLKESLTNLCIHTNCVCNLADIGTRLFPNGKNAVDWRDTPDKHRIGRGIVKCWTPDVCHKNVRGLHENIHRQRFPAVYQNSQRTFWRAHVDLWVPYNRQVNRYLKWHTKPLSAWNTQIQHGFDRFCHTHQHGKSLDKEIKTSPSTDGTSCAQNLWSSPKWQFFHLQSLGLWLS